jgi:transposase
MNPTGRPQCFTPAKAARIVRAIRRGLPYKLAAAAGGVSFNTFVRWRNEGSKPDGVPHFRQFLNQVRRAEAEAAQRLFGLIEERAKEHWQAAAWLLERRHPDLFGKNAVPPDQPLGEFAVLIDDD